MLRKRIDILKNLQEYKNKMDDLEILKYQIADKYGDDLFIRKITRDEDDCYSIKIYHFSTIDSSIKWARIKQDVCFMVKEMLGDRCMTNFVEQAI
jgi:hypothetical protein